MSDRQPEFRASCHPSSWYGIIILLLLLLRNDFICGYLIISSSSSAADIFRMAPAHEVLTRNCSFSLFFFGRMQSNMIKRLQWRLRMKRVIRCVHLFDVEEWRKFPQMWKYSRISWEQSRGGKKHAFYCRGRFCCLIVNWLNEVDLLDEEMDSWLFLNRVICMQCMGLMSFQDISLCSADVHCDNDDDEGFLSK